MSPNPPEASSEQSHDVLRLSLKVGDHVMYAGREYRVAGIDPQFNRPIALKNPDPQLAQNDQGCVRFEDIAEVVSRGKGKIDQISLKAHAKYRAVMYGLIGTKHDTSIGEWWNGFKTEEKGQKVERGDPLLVEQPMQQVG